MYLITTRNVESLDLRGHEGISRDYMGQAKARCPERLPSEVKLEHGRSSPLSSPLLGASFVRMTTIILQDSRSEWHVGRVARNSDEPDDVDLATKVIQQAINYALEQPSAVTMKGRTMGIDEILCGRAGLLWALLLLRQCCDGKVVDAALEKLFEEGIPLLAETILRAGSVKRAQDQSNAETISMPVLSWPWIDQYHALGAIHGSTGILSVLLSCNWSEIETYAANIATTVSQLCRFCIANDGHLPMSTPPFPTSAARTSPIVQMCHGTPGLLLVLAVARRNEAFRQRYWREEWDKAFDLGSRRVWEEGLLSKGGGVCHGISGNALPWVIWEDVQTDGLGERQDYLQYAEAFLMEARQTPPFGEGTKYRTPDNPYSLFEGLAGSIVVWLEASRVMTKRLLGYRP